jgi:hypothetical protein
VLPDPSLWFGAAGVEDHRVNHIGQVAFEGAEGFHRGLALGRAAPIVRPARSVMTQLDESQDVQDEVDTTIPGPR